MQSDILTAKNLGDQHRKKKIKEQQFYTIVTERITWGKNLIVAARVKKSELVDNFCHLWIWFLIYSALPFDLTSKF